MKLNVNQGWHIGLVNISAVESIYRHFLKCQLSVNVRTDKISAIGFGQILALNIGHISAIFPRYIGKPPIYRQLIEYWLSVQLRTDKILVIGNQLWSNIGNRLSAKFHRYAIPDVNYQRN